DRKIDEGKYGRKKRKKNYRIKNSYHVKPFIADEDVEKAAAEYKTMLQGTKKKSLMLNLLNLFGC
ncbi:17378_t:CDS:2, partial [Entrophospora sp. SA101]